ncbi:MAG: ABC-2 family transporter protein [Candidatus Micrarchaeales archaeon]
MLNKIRRNLHLFYYIQRYSWKTEFAYRLQGVVWLLFFLIQTLLTYVFITVIYSVSSGIVGWGYYQMLMLASTAIMLVGVINYMLDMGNLGSDLQSGNFDVALSRPVSHLMVMISNFNGAAAISSIISGAILFAYAASHTAFSPLQLGSFLVLFALGSAIALLFVITLILSSYRLFRGGSWISWVVQAISSAARYPLSIYGIIGSVVFTVLVPLGFATYYPVEAITGKLSYLYIAGLGIGEVVAIAFLMFVVHKLLEGYSSGMG